jgi:hypothetical protein
MEVTGPDSGPAGATIMGSVRRLVRLHPAGVLIALAVILTLVLPLVSLWAAGAEGEKGKAKSGFLADRHKGAGIECSGCHKETPPKEEPAMEACLKCHGPYEKLAAKGEKLEHNPHASHLGELECFNCHHGHKPSVDYCARCHTFGFKVP